MEEKEFQELKEDNEIVQTPINENHKPQYKTNSALFHFLYAFGIVFLGIFFLCQVYLTPIDVVGWSMLPNINASATSDDDQVHIDTVLYRKANSYTYGDVIIISNLEQHYVVNENPNKKVDYLIKRVVACPGDTITFYYTSEQYNASSHTTRYYYDYSVVDKNGNSVSINDESYRKENMYFIQSTSDYYGISANICNPMLQTQNRKKSITLDENCYFAMGDNRNNSLDSRFFGEVNYNDICGNVRLQIKYGGNIWTALFDKLKQLLSFNFIKECL